MPVIAQETIIQFLMWACGVLGTGLICTVVWIAIGVMARLDKIQINTDARLDALKESSEVQFKAFGQQLANVHELVTQDIHKHDVRIVRIEEWRKARDRDAPTND